MNGSQQLLLTYPGNRPPWANWEDFRHGWPAERRLGAGLRSIFITAYTQVGAQLQQRAMTRNGVLFPSLPTISGSNDS